MLAGRHWSRVLRVGHDLQTDSTTVSPTRSFRGHCWETTMDLIDRHAFIPNRYYGNRTLVSVTIGSLIQFWRFMLDSKF